MNLRDVIPTAENSSNFNVVPESITEVGTTLENLKAAVCGETGASVLPVSGAELKFSDYLSEFERYAQKLSLIHISEPTRH